MSSNILQNIETPKDLRKLSSEKLPFLSEEIRKYIIQTVSKTGGHLGASLGAVEIAVAVHYFFNTPEDKLVWDVGHQAYAHKILTGRKNNFHSLRKFGGISGFLKRGESEFDTFGAGHSSTSISAALGMAEAMKLKNENSWSIAVIGNASIASGMAFEALNHATDLGLNLVIILNDNNMSIDSSVGGLQKHFNSLKNNSSKGNFFENLGIEYYSPTDGHNVLGLLNTFKSLKKNNQIKLIHLNTEKGKGIPEAKENQTLWHAPGKFNPDSNQLISKQKTKIKYQDIFGNTITRLAEKNEKIYAVSPAMLSGSSLMEMKEKFPKRVTDTGISEQHAVTFCAGLATQGLLPFCVVYSTFLQRAYDQIIHDVALQNLPVVFCIDRAGLVGQDGETHHGYFDLAFMNAIPNMMVCAPMNAQQLANILFTVQKIELKNPFAIRYPRGESDAENFIEKFENIPIGKGKKIKEGKDLMVLTIGKVGQTIQTVLSENNLNKVGHFDMIFLKPLDKDLLKEVFEKYSKILVIEEGVYSGGLGMTIQSFALENSYKGIIVVHSLPDAFIPHGKVSDLEREYGFDKEGILNLIKSNLSI